MQGDLSTSSSLCLQLQPYFAIFISVTRGRRCRQRHEKWRFSFGSTSPCYLTRTLEIDHFHSCVLSCLAFEWKWGWSCPCFVKWSFLIKNYFSVPETFPVRNVIANKNEVYFKSGANQNRNNITNQWNMHLSMGKSSQIEATILDRIKWNRKL